jgi:hypothetical protein
MRFGRFKFGTIRIDGKSYEHDVVIDSGRIRKRKKKPSKSFWSTFGHTPLSNAEDIPWACRRLVVGTGANGALPVRRPLEVRAPFGRRAIPGLGSLMECTDVIGVAPERVFVGLEPGTSALDDAGRSGVGDEGLDNGQVEDEFRQWRLLMRASCSGQERYGGSRVRFA